MSTSMTQDGISHGRSRALLRSIAAGITLLLVLLAHGAYTAPANADDLPQISPPPTIAIAGDLKVGSTVTIESGAWDPADVALTYTWYADDVLLAAASGDQTTLTADLLGRLITVRIAATSEGYADTEVIVSAESPIEAGDFTAIPKPKITGTPQVGVALQATSAKWNPDAALTYQWSAGGKAIDNATKATFTPGSAQQGKTLTVRVTGAAAGYKSTSVVSAETKAVAYGKLSSTPKPTIAGTARVGAKLTAKPGSWKPDVALTYQWRANGKNIKGATKSTYTADGAVKGKKISVVVTGKKVGFTTVSQTSASTKAVANGVFSKAPKPTISGTAQVGKKLTAKPGNWAPAAKLSYQWKANGKAIKGATRATFTVTGAQHGKRITVTVTAKKANYTTKSMASSATAKVAKPFGKTSVPKISGKVRTGSTLKVTVGSWSPKPSFSYQWKANGTPIKGATKSSYKLKDGDVGKKITVTVTGKRSTYITKSRTSSATAKVAGPLPTLTKNGTFKVGTDIAAGTYVAKGGDGCYWERRSSAGSSFSGIIANDFSLGGQRIVTIAKSDKYFMTSDCGSWTRILSQASPKTSFGDGVYAVGVHIKPGVYKAPGGYGCYWAALSGFSGSLSDIIENDFTLGGQQYVRIYADDRGFETSDCGTWKRVSG